MNPPVIPLCIEAVHFVPFRGYLRFGIYVQDRSLEDSPWFLCHSTPSKSDEEFGPYWKMDRYFHFDPGAHMSYSRRAVQFVLDYGLGNLMRQTTWEVKELRTPGRPDEWMKVALRTGRGTECGGYPIQEFL